MQDGVTFSYAPLMIVSVVFMLIGMLVSWRLKSKFNKYSKIPSQRGMSGKEIAEQMLRDSGVHDVKIISVPGRLTDHYNPTNKTVNLSDPVYNGRNAAAAAVAAHECGHAIQHATSYRWLTFRSQMVPMQNIAGTLLQVIMFALMLGGALLSNFISIETIMWVLAACYGAIALFSLVTLPVEFDASNRALAWIKDSGTATHEEYEMSKDALKWAAMTYVTAALAAIANLVVILMQLLGNRD